MSSRKLEPKFLITSRPRPTKNFANQSVAKPKKKELISPLFSQLPEKREKGGKIPKLSCIIFPTLPGSQSKSSYPGGELSHFVFICQSVRAKIFHLTIVRQHKLLYKIQRRNGICFSRRDYSDTPLPNIRRLNYS